MEKRFITPLNLKYKETSIIPWHLSYEADPDSLSEMIGGEVVKFEYIEKYDVDKPESLQALKIACKEVFGLEYSLVEAIWRMRRPDLPLKVWYKVNMHKQICLN